MSPVKPIPDGYHVVTPYLIIDGAAEAIEFYKKAFGAVERLRIPAPGGKIGHAEIVIGDCAIMLADENPEYGTKGPKTFGGSAVGIHLYVENADAVFSQALSCGASPLMPVTDLFCGNRTGILVDPYGHIWHVATQTEELSPEEMCRRAEALMKQPVGV